MMAWNLPVLMPSQEKASADRESRVVVVAEATAPENIYCSLASSPMAQQSDCHASSRLVSVIVLM
jgi:hypothetical protein